MEATLVLPLFLIFWFGIVDWGITFYMHHSLVYSVNAAARWAVVNTYNPDKIKAMVVYGDPDSTATGAGLFGLTKSKVNVQLVGTEAANNRRIVISVSDYSGLHFTPYFAGTYTGREVLVSLPAEDLDSNP